LILGFSACFVVFLLRLSCRRRLVWTKWRLAKAVQVEPNDNAALHGKEQRSTTHTHKQPLLYYPDTWNWIVEMKQTGKKTTTTTTTATTTWINNSIIKSSSTLCVDESNEVRVLWAECVIKLIWRCCFFCADWKHIHTYMYVSS
jgi:hypothetical protein